MTAVRGDLGGIGVPRLFRAIADERRTGRLVLEPGSGGQEGHVYFRRGEAYHARLVGSGIQLGTRLVSAGYLADQDVEGALAIQKSEGGLRRLGEILIEDGMVPRQAIEKIVRQQIEDTIFEILRWEGGTFQFEPDVLSDEDIGLQVSVENLVMEGARRFREWHQITRRIPTLEAVPRFAEEEGAAIEVALTPEEWSLVSKVDGTSTVVELARQCGFTELEGARCVFGLVTAGLLEVELPEGAELPEDDDELEAVFDELERALEEATRARSETQTLEGLEEIAAQTDEDAVVDLQKPEPVTEAIEDLDGEPFYAHSEEVPTGHDLPRAEPDPEPEPVLEAYVPEPEPEPEPVLEAYVPDPEPEPEPVLEAYVPEPEPEPEPVLEAYVPEPEPEPEPVLEAYVPEPEPEPEPVLEAYVPEPLPELEPEPEPEPYVPEPVPELEPEPAAVMALAPEGAILAEETGPSDFDAASLAQVFADLSTPPEQGLETTHVFDDASESPPQQAPATRKEPPQPVDPNVDTSALIREFSALGLDDEGIPADVIGTSKQSPKTDRTDKSKGRFGRRKR
ncbi:MAG: DUF4388 domain-containing protein [Actinobacteria bacterium]|nr:DUF4388 domain-containing protein [Actinomycetota bacterium]